MLAFFLGNTKNTLAMEVIFFMANYKTSMTSDQSGSQQDQTAAVASTLLAEAMQNSTEGYYEVSNETQAITARDVE